MAVAFDAITNSGASFTHTPVGTPRGVLVLVKVNAQPTDVITGVTYGGVAMTEIALSPLLFDGTTDGSLYGYFLGSSIPTGAQTVATTASAGTPGVSCITLTASADTEIVDTSTISTNASGDVTGTLSLGGRTSYCAEVWWTSSGSVAGTTQLAGWTNRLEADHGTETTGTYTYDTVGSTDVTFGLNRSTAVDIIVLAAAVSEVSAGTTDGAGSAGATFAGSGTGASTAASTASGAAVFGASGAGASTAASAGAGAATFGATGVGASIAAAAGAAPAVFDALGVGDALAGGEGAGTAGAVFTASGVGASIAEAVGVAPMVFGAEGIIVNATAPAAAAPPPGGGAGRRRKNRRILLDDGRIYVPATEEDYRDYVNQLLTRALERAELHARMAEEGVLAPAKRVGRRPKPKPPLPVKSTVPATLPDPFFEILARGRQNVLNSQLIAQAWAAYQADLDEEDVIMLLLS